MTDLRKAAEMALEALMQTTLEDVMVEVEPNVWEYKSIVAINALRQALAEEALDRMVAENQKLGLYDDDLQTAIKKGTKAWADVPAGWVDELRGNDTPEVTPDVDNAKLGTTAGVLHKEWVGLTEQDIDSYALDIGVTANKAPPWLVKYARDIEAKLKEKNVPQP